VRTRNFRHEYDYRVSWIGDELGRLGACEKVSALSVKRSKTVQTGEAHDIAGPLDNRKLEAEANTEKWYFLLARPLDC
jgi:hypothetical protein